MHLLHRKDSKFKQYDRQEAEVALLSFRYAIDASDGAVCAVKDNSISRAENVRHFLNTDNTRQSLIKINHH